MGIRRTLSLTVTAVIVLGGSVAGCARQETTATARIDEKTFRLKPAANSMRLAFLTAQLAEPAVVERVNRDSGEVVDPPRLKATLKLKNASSDQAARLIAGEVEYLEAGGRPIALGKGREDTSFRFYGSQSDRLDPGMEFSQAIEVPFPAAALKEGTLADIRVSLTYIPIPYREESVTVPVSLVK